ncbi:MAG: hypothetical protein Q4C47_04185 [Planctomycetia bacterium]|nr:hypothetical protein [Planctomycetia bacterium]
MNRDYVDGRWYVWCPEGLDGGTLVYERDGNVLLNGDPGKVGDWYRSGVAAWKKSRCARRFGNHSKEMRCLDAAVFAFEATLRLDPDHFPAKRFLAKLYAWAQVTLSSRGS